MECRGGSSRGRSPEQCTLSRLSQPVAVTADLDDVGMVQQPVEHGAAQGGVSVEGPRVRPCSGHPLDDPRRDRPAAPSCGSLAQSTRTREPAPRACGTRAPAQPSGAGTPARKAHGASTSGHLLRTMFRCPLKQLHIADGVACAGETLNLSWYDALRYVERLALREDQEKGGRVPLPQTPMNPP